MNERSEPTATDPVASTALLSADWDLWECLTINTHEQGKVITDAIRGEIQCLLDVVRVFPLGSYGMELIVIADTDNKERLTGEIAAIIFADNRESTHSGKP